MLASMFIEAPLTRALVEMPFDLADAGRVDRLADLEDFVHRFEHDAGEARATSLAAADLVQRLRSGQDTSSDSEQAAAVELLMAAERNLGDVHRRLSGRARQNETAAAAHAPGFLPLFQRMTALIDKTFLTYLEAARDVRWEVLALQADAEPPADGPILSSAVDVDRFFESLPPSP